MSNTPNNEEPLKPAGKGTVAGTYLYNLRMNLDDGTTKDEDYANLLRERLDHAITHDRQEEGIESIRVGRREQHAKKNIIRSACNLGRARIRYLMERVDPDEEKTDRLVKVNTELGYIVRTHSKTIAEQTRSLISSQWEDLERATKIPESERNRDGRHEVSRTVQ